MADTIAYALIDFGASHSFIAATFAKKLGRVLDKLEEVCGMSLPSRDSLKSQSWFREIPIVICGRGLYVHLIILEMYD